MTGSNDHRPAPLRAAAPRPPGGRGWREASGEGGRSPDWAYFLESLLSDIDSLRLYAGIHRKVHGFHRLLSKRFPFAVYYSTEPDRVQVRAVLDCRRDPRWTRRKLT